jgi:hypothetical protein
MVFTIFLRAAQAGFTRIFAKIAIKIALPWRKQG